MKQTYFLITLFAALAIGVISINSEITLPKKKMKHQKLMIMV